MKKLLFIYALLFCAVCFTACEKEYAEDIATGSLNINGQEYDLKKQPANFYNHMRASYIELDSRKQEGEYEGTLSLFIDIDYRDTYITEWIILSLASSGPLKDGDDVAKISSWNDKDAAFNDIVKYRSGNAFVSNLNPEGNSAVVTFKDFTVVNSYNPTERVYTINGSVKIFYNCDWDL